MPKLTLELTEAQLAALAEAAGRAGVSAEEWAAAELASRLAGPEGAAFEAALAASFAEYGEVYRRLSR